LTNTIEQGVQYLDLTPDDAAEFVHNLQEHYEQHTLSNRNATRSLLCRADVRQDQTTTYARLDKLDDIKDATPALAYQKAITNLTSAQALALSQWPAQLKPQTPRWIMQKYSTTRSKLSKWSSTLLVSF